VSSITDKENLMKVIKRDGKSVQHNIVSVQNILSWATHGANVGGLPPIKGVSPSDIEIKARIQYYDGITTKEIHETLVRATEELIDEDHPNYDHVAARLVMFDLNKQVYSSIVPSHIFDVVKNNVKLGYYEPKLLNEWYTKEEWNQINSFIDHKRDDLFKYAGIMQVKNKYLIHHKDRAIETPQVMYIMIAATLFNNYAKDIRLGFIKRYYDQISTFKVSLPTPINNGVRTTSRQFSSCVLIDTGDSLESITETARVALKYGANRAGMGINVGMIRGEKMPVKNGLFTSAGPIPFYKFLRSAVKACTQSGTRASSATFNLPFWHIDFESIIVLKNDEGTDDVRIRDIDYSVHINKILFDRVKAKKNVTLFTPNEVPELYEAFYSKNYDNFVKLYEEAEANPNLHKKSMKATELVGMLLNERFKTGRIYIMFADNVNTQSSINESIRMSNLCFGGENRIHTEHGYITMEEVYLRGGESSYKQRKNNQLKIVNRNGLVNSTQVYLTSESSDLYRVKYKSGREITVTSDHQHIMLNNDRKSTKELRVGDKINLIGDSHVFGKIHDPEYAELAGAVIGDGSITITRGKYPCALIRSWNNPDLINYWVDKLNVLRTNNGLKSVTPANKQYMLEFEYDRYTKSCRYLGQRLADDGLWQRNKHIIPASIWQSDRETIAAFTRGLYDTDGHFQCNPDGEASVVFNQSKRNLVLEVQKLLGWLGINSRIINDKPYKTPEFSKSGRKIWGKASSVRLFISRRENLQKYADLVGFSDVTKRNKLSQYLSTHTGSNNSSENWVDSVISLEFDRTDKTYCLTEPKNNEVVVNNIVIGQCQEIAQHTMHGDDGKERLTALCTLSAINWGEVKTEPEMEEACEMAVRGLDELLDYQDYLDESAFKHTQIYRPLGIGIINFAYWMHNKHLRWGEGLDKIAEKAESQYYYLLKASNQLAKEKGKISAKTLYANGEFVWQKSPLNGKFELKKDWNKLSKELKEHGIRNATLVALMPSEASSIVSNATNGIEPPRSLVTSKGSKDGKYPIVVPALSRLSHVYQSVWDIKVRDYLSSLSPLQMFNDQAISANTSYRLNSDGSQIPMSQLLNDIMFAHSVGMKTLYYNNQLKSANQVEVKEESCTSGACAI
jgi:ribonucleotide reductase alpha subunit